MNANKELGKSPDNVKSIRITDDFVETECGVYYYGSDDGYNRLATLILKIVDWMGGQFLQFGKKDGQRSLQA